MNYRDTREVKSKLHVGRAESGYRQRQFLGPEVYTGALCSSQELLAERGVLSMTVNCSLIIMEKQYAS